MCGRFFGIGLLNGGECMEYRDWMQDMGFSEQEKRAYEEAVDSALQSLVSGVSADPETDLGYLRECREYYMETNLGRDLVPVCDALMHLLTPAAEDEALRVPQSDIKTMRELYHAALVERRKEQWKTGLGKTELLAKQAVQMEKTLNADREDRYFDFQEVIHEFLFRDRYEPDFNLRRTPLPFFSYIDLHVGFLLKNERYDEVGFWIGEAEKLDPVTYRIPQRRAEIAEGRKDAQALQSAGKEICTRAVNRSEMARGLKTLACSAGMLGDRVLETACLVHAGRFEPLRTAETDKLQQLISLPECEGLLKTDRYEAILAKAGIPLSLEADVVRVSRNISYAFERMDCKELAELFAHYTASATEKD